MAAILTSGTTDARIHVLKDGRVIRIRALMPGDAPALRSMLLRASPQSRYQRFLAPIPRVTDSFVNRLIMGGAEGGAFVATELDGAIVAVAHHGPLRNGDSEVAILVEDEWQSQGLGRLLMTRLVEQLVALGGRTISGTILRDNHASIRLLEGSFGAIRRAFDGPHMDFRASIVHVGVEAARGSA